MTDAASPARPRPPAITIIGLVACVIVILALALRIGERMTYGNLTRSEVRGALVGLTLGQSAIDAHTAYAAGRSVPMPSVVTIPQLRGLPGAEVNLPVERVSLRLHGARSDAGTGALDDLLMVRGLTREDCVSFNTGMNGSSDVPEATQATPDDLSLPGDEATTIGCVALDSTHAAYVVIDLH